MKTVRFILLALLGHVSLAAAEELTKDSLATWERLTIGILISPGCTEPYRESVTIDRGSGTITHKVDEIGSKPEQVTTTNSALDRQQAKAITDAVWKHYSCALSEKSVPERLEALGDDEAAKAELRKKHPPGIGGYSQTFITVSVEKAGTRIRTTDEFAGSGREFQTWLRSLRNLAGLNESR